MIRGTPAIGKVWLGYHDETHRYIVLDMRRNPNHGWEVDWEVDLLSMQNGKKIIRCHHVRLNEDNQITFRDPTEEEWILFTQATLAPEMFAVENED